MKNKKKLIPIIVGGVMIVGLSAFVLLFQDDQKVSGPTDLKAPVFTENSEAEKASVDLYKIDRTEFNVIDYYKVTPVEINEVKAMTGTRRGQANSSFTKIVCGENEFNIDFTPPSLLQIGSFGGGVVVENPGIYQFVMYKVADSATTLLVGDDADAKLTAEYETIKQKYIDECNRKTTFDKVDVYDDSKDGGILTFTPMAEFMKKNNLEREFGIYSYSVYRKILNQCFTVPDDYQYTPGTEWNNGSFSRTGVFKTFKDRDELGHEIFYLLYSDKGVYACKMFYIANKENETEESKRNNIYGENYLMNTIVPAYTDADLIGSGNSGEDYKEDKDTTPLIVIKDNYTAEDIFSLDTYDGEINGRIYIDLESSDDDYDSIDENNSTDEAQGSTGTTEAQVAN